MQTNSLSTSMKTLLIIILVASASFARQPPTEESPTCLNREVNYKGVYLEGVESFLGIRFAEDASGSNRFKPPIPHVPLKGDTIAANNPGPACMQDKVNLGLSYVNKTSEDCLRLNVWRPNGTRHDAKLPVLVYIYGGERMDNQTRFAHDI